MDGIKIRWNKSSQNAIELYYHNIASWLLAIFGFVAVIGFVISGILYFISAGDEDQQERAKRAMIYSITGVIVGLAGLVVIYAVNYLYMGSSNFSRKILNYFQKK